MLCAASEIFRILAYSALCLLGVWWHIQSYSVLLRHFYAYWDIIKAYLLIQAYSAPCVTLAYSQPCHILSLGIFITRGLFETLRNVDQAYAEPRYRALFSHIQAYSELGHITKDLRIFKTLTYLKRNTYSALSQRFKMEFFAKIAEKYFFFQNAPSYIFDRVLNTYLISLNKCSLNL